MTSLVLGIIALVLGFIPIINVVSFALAPLAIIFGIVGLVVSSKRGSGKGTSIAGLVTGLLGLAVTIFMYVAIYSALGEACEDSGFSGNAGECLDEISEDVDDLETM
ncbi:hypothetical protein [Glycomyces xiaoerkulensis]|uniref:hypothetical protein n=1 Tax=Glycomyces xiaoerkulensis TaxID=2038139 RepID=UPI0012FFEA14|nr:hypothetical protein [Glycomyces xiaoerkulensis]